MALSGRAGASADTDLVETRAASNRAADWAARFVSTNTPPDAAPGDDAFFSGGFLGCPDGLSFFGTASFFAFAMTLFLSSLSHPIRK
jgi:hypothetical protein